MSAFIESKIAWFRDSQHEYGYRHSTLREEIRRQEGVVESYAKIVNPNPRDQQHARDYLAALQEVSSELEREAVPA